MRLFSGAAAVLTVAALLIAEETRAQSPVDFAWGDVFASEPTSLDEQLSGALQAPAGRDLAFSFGGVAGYGEAFGLYGPGLAPLFFVDRDAGAVRFGPLAVRTLDVVATTALGGPLWNTVSTRVFVVRAAGNEPVDPVVYESTVVQLARGRRSPSGVRDALGPLMAGASAPPTIVQDVRVVAHDLTSTDLTRGTFAGPGGGTLAWEVLGHAHRTKVDIFDVDLFDAGKVAFAESSFLPSGLAGNGVLIEDDDTYDSPGRDMHRRYARMFWNGASAGAQRVGFELDLTDAGLPRDVSAGGSRLVFTVAGSNSLCLSVSLEDALGNRAAVPFGLGEINGNEKSVVLSATDFSGVDLTSVTRLGFHVRDPLLASAPTCGGGQLLIFNPTFSRDSSHRKTPQNVFWSNDPLIDAAGGPGAPLTDLFLGQPSSVYKYFVGVGGPSLGSAQQILTEITAIRAADLTPHVVIELFPAQNGATLDDIVAGDYDQFFRTLFEGCRAIGGRIELAPLHEANGFWYPWRGDLDPQGLRDAWRRIDRVRDDARAHNVALAYVVSCLNGAPGVQRAAAAGFPGDDVVDMIGIQGFESGYSTDTVTSNEIFSTTTQLLDRLSDLPFVLTEYGFYTLPGAQHEKGQLATWSLGDQIDGRAYQPYSGAIYFNVSKFENGAFRNWRLYEDNAQVLNEVLPYIFDLELRAASPRLSSVAEGRRASDTALRLHTRLFARLFRP